MLLTKYQVISGVGVPSTTHSSLTSVPSGTSMCFWRVVMKQGAPKTSSFLGAGTSFSSSGTSVGHKISRLDY